MLNYDPQLRIKPYDALQHPFFRRSDSTTRHHSSSTAVGSPSSAAGKSEASQPLNMASNGITNSSSQVFSASYQLGSLQAAASLSSAPGSVPNDASLFLDSNVMPPASQSSYQHATRVFNNPVSSQLSAQAHLSSQRGNSLQQQLPEQLSSSNMSIDTAASQPSLQGLPVDHVDPIGENSNLYIVRTSCIKLCSEMYYLYYAKLSVCYTHISSIIEL